MANAGIAVRMVDKYAILHDKIIVPEPRHLQTGSFNYSQAAAESNWENVLVVWQSAQLAASNLMRWNSRFDQGSVYTRRYGGLKFSYTGTTIIVVAEVFQGPNHIPNIRMYPLSVVYTLSNLDMSGMLEMGALHTRTLITEMASFLQTACRFHLSMEHACRVSNDLEEVESAMHISFAPYSGNPESELFQTDAAKAIAIKRRR